MADISLGTFEVLSLTQMGTVVTVGPAAGSPPPPPTINVGMSQVGQPSGGAAGIMISGLTPPATRAVSDVHLGKQYEVILREVVRK
jgi:hypothetical protein